MTFYYNNRYYEGGEYPYCLLYGDEVDITPLGVNNGLIHLKIHNVTSNETFATYLSLIQLYDDFTPYKYDIEPKLTPKPAEVLTVARCPQCGNILYKKCEKCAVCGQVIDWDNTYIDVDKNTEPIRKIT